MRTTPENQRGVTLVELVVVLAIASILVAIGIANLDTHQAKLRAAAYTMKTHLMGAKSTAIKRNENVLVNLDATGDAYNATTASGVVLFAKQLEQGIDLSSGSSSVTFTPLGMADSTNVLLVGLSGGNYTITINNVGRVKLQ